MSQTAQRVPWELAHGPYTAFIASQTQTLRGNMRQVTDSMNNGFGGVPPSSDRELLAQLIAYNATNLANAVQVPENDQHTETETDLHKGVTLLT